MKLKRFRVRNFRSVEDSGWIDADDVTAFVGVNESGKTNLMLPLWKFNPAKEGKLEPTSDYPKNNYGAIRDEPKRYYFVEVEFDLASYASKFASLTNYTEEEIRKVVISRNYEGIYSWSFPNANIPKQIDSTSIKECLKNLQASVNSSNEMVSEAGLKNRCVTAITDGISKISDTFSRDIFESIQKVIKGIYTEDHAKGSAIHPRLQQSLVELENIGSEFYKKLPTSVDGAWDDFKSNLPVFLYYSNYGNLDSEIYLPHVVENLTREGLGAKEAAKARTLRVLFQFVKLDPVEILELGRDFKDKNDPGRKPTESEIEAINLKKKERSILLQSAGTRLTAKFKDWWKQGDYRFRFEADGDHFRIWVSDDRRPEEVELEGRSTGLQWFLSFYLVFLVESEGEHKNAILLLDEPGLSLHPLAQKNLSRFFSSLSATNQILFTTHSPFLVDSDNLDQARKVYVADDGSTKATSNLNEGESKKSQPGASYALNSALNLNVAESLLIGCNPVIVEGASDQHILSAIKTVLIGAGKIAPIRELVFPPSGGAKSVKVISSILLGRDDVLPYVVLDDDPVGKSVERELKSELYKGDEEKILNIAAVTGMPGSEIEDIVPADIYVDVIDRIIKLDEPFIDHYHEDFPIVPQIEKWTASQNYTLDKGWKVTIAIGVKKRILAKRYDDLNQTTQERWEKTFQHFLPS